MLCIILGVPQRESAKSLSGLAVSCGLHPVSLVAMTRVTELTVFTMCLLQLRPQRWLAFSKLFLFISSFASD